MENVFILDPNDASHLSAFPPAMADIHIDCVMNSHTMATFLPPLSRDGIIAYYNSNIEQIRSGVYSVITEWVPVDAEYPPPEGGVVWQGRELTGFVMLHRTPSETGPFRAQVEKLLVSSRYRKRGVARRVMARLEDEARRTESWLLMLDTTIGSGAEFVYPKLGYISFGIIPKFGLNPKDNKTLEDEIFFYKDLRQ